MKFVDQATITVSAGKGGPGAVSFRREKFIPEGGPDGGNGGAGGSVIVVADRNVHTLLDFHFKPKWKGEDGARGSGSRSDGKSGNDITIRLPIGTEIYRQPNNELIVDLREDGQEFILAKGGRGGKGNDFFKSATNRTPTHAQPGEPGEEGEFTFSLKLVADIGLVGFPNAGKSTLISRISSATPKIADYPFTTLTPNLGVAKAKDGRSFVVADIPGLIPGAHTGKGLGTKFLKHIERTKIIAHLIDPNQCDDDGNPLDPLKSFELINHELREFSELLANKSQIVVLTKSDTIVDREALNEVINKFQELGHSCYTISSVSGEGLDELLLTFSKSLAAAESKEDVSYDKDIKDNL